MFRKYPLDAGKGLFQFLTLIWLLVFLLGSGTSAVAKKRSKRKKPSVKSRFHPGMVRLGNADSPEFRSFLFRMKELRRGKPGNAGILILGDSHMQCEDFGTAFSRYLQDSLQIPYAGRGFVFPYPLARTSHRSDMEFRPNSAWHGCRFTKESNDCEWGLAGWTAHCLKDSVDFSWKLNAGSFRRGDEVILLCPFKNAADFRVQVQDSSGRKQELNYSRKNAGFSGFLPEPGTDLRFSIQKKNPSAEFILQGIVLRPQAQGFVAGISGTNGARLDHYLQNPDFQRHLSVINPALVLISLGTNDAFASNFDPETTRNFLQQLLTRIKSALPDAAIVLAGPPDHCYRRGRVNPKTAQVNKVFSEIAESLDFVFWNQQQAMGGKGSVFAWRAKGLVTKDMIHFTPQGYALQARLLGRSFRKEF
jgi:lysophospholipase L1-like esterase